MVTEPLIHNQGVGPKRERRYRQTRYTSRDTEVVSKSSNRPSRISRTCNLGHRVFRLRNPSTFRIFTAKLLPMIPNKAIRNKEIIRIKVHIVHHRREQGLHTDNFACVYGESIAGQNLVEEERDDITNVERGFQAGGTIKARSGDINMRGKAEMGFCISIHSFVTSLTSGIAGVGSAAGSFLKPRRSRKSGSPLAARYSVKELPNFSRTSAGRAINALS